MYGSGGSHGCDEDYDGEMKVVVEDQLSQFYLSDIQFVELQGDQAGYDDLAIITGLGTINCRSYMFMGHQKGGNTKENIQCNFGMPTPHGYVFGWMKSLILNCVLFYVLVYL